MEIKFSSRNTRQDIAQEANSTPLSAAWNLTGRHVMNEHDWKKMWVTPVSSYFVGVIQVVASHYTTGCAQEVAGGIFTQVENKLHSMYIFSKDPISTLAYTPTIATHMYTTLNITIDYKKLKRNWKSCKWLV